MQTVSYVISMSCLSLTVLSIWMSCLACSNDELMRHKEKTKVFRFLCIYFLTILIFPFSSLSYSKQWITLYMVRFSYLIFIIFKICLLFSLLLFLVDILALLAGITLHRSSAYSRCPNDHSSFEELNSPTSKSSQVAYISFYINLNTILKSSGSSLDPYLTPLSIVNVSLKSLLWLFVILRQGSLSSHNLDRTP